MLARHYNQRGRPIAKPLALYDRWLILAGVMLLIIGIMMVASSSMMVSTKIFHNPFYYVLRQTLFLSFGLLLGFFVIRTDSQLWERLSVPLLILCFILLILVLIPGIGKVVNGSRRWLSLGFIGIQISELSKAVIIFYIAGYLVRQKKGIENDIFGFLKPMLVLGIFATLLLLEPDFGATVVLSSTVLAMLFLTQVKLRYYISLIVVVASSLAIMAISSPYRMMRLTAFLNPWADQFNSGYQLTQSLIAFGRGGVTGLGLGQGVQKLFYLPEAHTDFLFAVVAEELGLIGGIFVILLYTVLVGRGLCIGYNSYIQERFFQAYTAYGITFWLGLQAAINIGVNSGLLPTKGLTLPLMSYGGASMIVCVGALALLVRIDHENRWHALGL